MKKRFGQYLLTDKNYLEKIIKSVSLNKDDVVLEIGSGTGLLTSKLAKQVKTVFACELEREILKKLKENLKNQEITNVKIIESDFLKIDLERLANKSFKIIGNIPYNITSSILLKLFGEMDKPALHLNMLESVYLMLQKEVAERITANPGTKAYSPLSLLVQFFSKPTILFYVPRGAFVPVPKVDSAFVALLPKKEHPKVNNPTLLKNIIRISFQQRRKKLINSLNKLIKDKDLVIRTFDRLHLNQNLRAENLSLEEYLKISDTIYA